MHDFNFGIEEEYFIFQQNDGRVRGSMSIIVLQLR